jgi:hypothetical protein
MLDLTNLNDVVHLGMQASELADRYPKYRKIYKKLSMLCHEHARNLAEDFVKVNNLKLKPVRA